MDYYTEIKVTVKYPDFPREYTVRIERWDCTLDDMYELFENVLKSMGFAVKEGEKP